MKRITSICLLGTLSFVFSTVLFAAPPVDCWSKKDAMKWLNSREWAGGLTLQTDPSVNVVEFAKQYHLNKPAWDLAFAWLRENDLATVAVGKYVLDSANVTVTVTDGPSVRAFEKTKWEGHSQKIDLQYIVRGQEKMGIAPLSKAMVVVPYNAKKDNGFYSFKDEDSHYIVAQPGRFLLFFPSDAHRPNIKVEGCDTVKKIVFKIEAVTDECPDKRQAAEAAKIESPQ
jgi:biofilm protein TabA